MVVQTVLTSVIIQAVFAVLLFINTVKLLNYISGFIIVLFMLVIFNHLKQMQVTYRAVISNNYVKLNSKKFFYKDYDFILTVSKVIETKILVYEKDDKNPGVYPILFNFEKFDYDKEYIKEELEKYVEIERQSNW